MTKQRTLTVADLIRALKKLPPEMRLKHFSAYYDGSPNSGKEVTIANINDFGLYIYVENGETFLCTEYDMERDPKVPLDFSGAAT